MHETLETVKLYLDKFYGEPIVCYKYGFIYTNQKGFLGVAVAIDKDKPTKVIISSAANYGDDDGWDSHRGNVIAMIDIHSPDSLERIKDTVHDARDKMEKGTLRFTPTSTGM
ncbi:unnamed protein product [marine sediment metagenome]|uniref:Uncharacterized protein n=1 Tax=marine sediment metagenome TaxID=412755 RepID=X0WS41_9ZZZZ